LTPVVGVVYVVVRRVDACFRPVVTICQAQELVKFVTGSLAQPEVNDYDSPVRLVFSSCLILLLTGCAPHSFFYYPNRKLYGDPARMGFRYDTVQYPSLNGKRLWAVLIRTEQKPKGTVVHFHGNFGNVSNHFPLATFLVHAGFDVLSFDYQGYGASEGRPTPKRTVEDGIATIRFAQAHLRDPNTGVVVFGQSLGGAAAVVAVAREPLAKAAVIEAAFSSYSKMGKTALARSAWTWAFSFLVPLLVTHAYDPIDQVDKISPRPVFFIHGDADTITPMHMTMDLHHQAREPKKLWIVNEAGHLECRTKEPRKYEQEIVTFFEQALARKGGTPERRRANE
jgi:fermentation-respiration switch protein FrsA (DUF1100 family)